MKNYINYNPIRPEGTIIKVSIPLRGIGYEKPYTHGDLVTNSFQGAFAPSYGNNDVTSEVSI
ncbi:hypothetical protein [Sphaerospermopsis reniformis]|uniref:hypothetical protein n=1 Tax=Sphaerospermopsis reniformis TaxID=531300 RepID=UPI003FCDDA61